MVTRRLVTARGTLALVLFMCLAGGPALKAARAAQEAAAADSGRGSIHGTLYQPDQKESLEGARVTAINVRTSKQYSSNVTTKNGNYDITGLPAGTYDVAVEINGEVFVADNLVDLSGGEGASLSYAVQPMRPANRVLKGLPNPRGSAAVMGVFKANATAVPSFWKSPGGITLLTILGAGAVLAIAGGSDDDDASPSTP